MGGPRAVSHNALRSGTVLSGRLRIERVVGQGSMGIVLEATDLPLQRRVAVKVMAPERAHNDESRKRFVREARAAVRLSSEHVTRLIDVGELDDGTPYLVMEYLVGLTLEQVLERDGLPPLDVAIDWVLQALDGVAEAHRAGLVHRDLKPENLFLHERPDRQPIVKVLDFGTVKDLVTKGTKLTRTGSTMGSPAYMPPEQVRAEDIDQRADVWAMGVTLYELLTGSLPFGGESVPQTLAAILRDPPIPLRSRRPDVPEEVEGVVNCALSKDPAGRYATATELLAALSMVRAKMPATTRNTKTLQLGQTPFRLSRPDAFAETTDMHRAVVETDSSRVRPRVVVNTRNEPVFETTSSPSQRYSAIPSSSSGAGAGAGAGGVIPSSQRGKAPSSRSISTHLIALGIAAGAAIIVGTVVGVVVSRKQTAPKTAASSSLTLPVPSAAAATVSVLTTASAPPAPPSASISASPSASASASTKRGGPRPPRGGR